jgi:predicted PurR-regulated permease PerM
MLEGSSIRMGIIQLMPGRSVERLLSIFVEIDTTLGDYLRGLCLEGMFVGGLMGISFFCIGLEYVFPLTLLAIVSVLIPFVGPLCVGALAAICALIQWGTWTGLLKVVAICLVVRFLDDSILQPVIMRRAVQMHPVTTIFTLMLGGTLAGTWGLLFAVPTFCIIKVLVRAGWDWYRSESGFSRSGFVRAVNIPPLI